MYIPKDSKLFILSPLIPCISYDISVPWLLHYTRFMHINCLLLIYERDRRCFGCNFGLGLRGVDQMRGNGRSGVLTLGNHRTHALITNGRTSLCRSSAIVASCCNYTNFIVFRLRIMAIVIGFNSPFIVSYL